MYKMPKGKAGHFSIEQVLMTSQRGLEQQWGQASDGRQ